MSNYTQKQAEAVYHNMQRQGVIPASTAIEVPNETDNHRKYKKIVGSIPVHELVRIVRNYPSVFPKIGRYAEFIEPMEEIENHINELKVKELCPHCKNSLFLSDLPDYDFTCYECDENFYSCEVLEVKEETYECCPHCGYESAYPAVFSRQNCPSCHRDIIICSMCEDMNCNNCKL